MLNMKKLRKMKPEGVSLKAWARSQGEKVIPSVGGEADHDITMKAAKLLGVLPGEKALRQHEKAREAHKARRSKSALLHSATRAARAKKSLKNAPKKSKKQEEALAA